MASLRAQLIAARTYCRPLDNGGIETWDMVCERVISHQRWLWERALGTKLNTEQEAELAELRQLMSFRQAALAGRTMWLGGTEVSRNREASMFNCSHTQFETVHDAVDMLWLLLQGAGVGFTPVRGTLNGFVKPIKEIEVIRSERLTKGGDDQNSERWEPDTKTWTITIGDSAEGWSKAVGKLLAGKYPADRLVFDLSNLRPAGGRLSRYGWLSSGDSVIADALPAIANILSERAGRLLTKIDILDIGNWLGVIQTGRRGAEICLVDYGDPEWEAFATAKKDYWQRGLHHRSQSNNSLVFRKKPSIFEIYQILEMMHESGGSEPGFYNAEAALRRAPWFKGTNPCGEILLGNKSFCNLSELNVAAFGNDHALHRAIWMLARANYRQTCVDLDDGILQRAWHENNQFLHLCGVGICGIMSRPDMTPYDFKILKNYAVMGAYSMADEMGLPRPKNVTTIKPGGTMPKVMDAREGVSNPLGQYIFNNVNFNSHDPLLDILEDAGYKMFNNPDQPDAVVVSLPYKWDDAGFEKVGGKMVNVDTAIEQLERYRSMMENYVEQNCSITVYYQPDELDDIAHWISSHWDNYVGVSFLPKQDPTKTANDLGFQYLPQEVVSEEDYIKYASTLKPVDLDNIGQGEQVDAEDECATGMCPVR